MLTNALTAQSLTHSRPSTNVSYLSKQTNISPQLPHPCYPSQHTQARPAPGLPGDDALCWEAPHPPGMNQKMLNVCLTMTFIKMLRKTMPKAKTNQVQLVTLKEHHRQKNYGSNGVSSCLSIFFEHDIQVVCAQPGGLPSRDSEACSGSFLPLPRPCHFISSERTAGHGRESGAISD